MIQIDDGGEFSHIMDEEFCVHALTEIYRGHRPFFKALREFQQKKVKRLLSLSETMMRGWHLRRRKKN